MQCVCGRQLSGRQTKWCSERCGHKARNRRTLPRRATCQWCDRKLPAGRNYRLYCSAKCRERDRYVRKLYPSLNWEWDADMVAACADRLLPLLTRRLERLN